MSSQELNCEGDGAIEVLSNQILQSGYGVGPNGFRILVDQPHMPTKVIYLLLQQDGVDVQASAGSYPDIALHITLSDVTYTAASVSTTTATYNLVQYNVYFFEFNTPFLTSLITSLELLNPRTDFSKTPQIVNSPQFIAPQA